MKRIKDIINPGNISTARTVLMKVVKSHPIPVDIQGTKQLVVAKFNDVNAFYKHFTGLDELEYYQDRVIELQDSLSEAQLKRREISYVLHDLRKKGLDVQDRLHKVKRHEEPGLFLELMKEETEFIKREREVFAALSEQERYEREIFTAFTNAIRDSQEKQRTRLEYTKYIGFGLTIFGALASYAITTWRTEDLKKVIKNTIKDDVKDVIEVTIDKLGIVNSAYNKAFLGQLSKEQYAREEKLWHQFASQDKVNKTLNERFNNLAKSHDSLLNTVKIDMQYPVNNNGTIGQSEEQNSVLGAILCISVFVIVITSLCCRS